MYITVGLCVRAFLGGGGGGVGGGYFRNFKTGLCGLNLEDIPYSYIYINPGPKTIPIHII